MHPETGRLSGRLLKSCRLMPRLRRVGKNSSSMKTTRRSENLLFRVLMTGAVSLVGCAGCRPAANVSGTVSFCGEPLPAGRVTFLCDGGKKPVISGDISANGRYEVGNLPVGSSRVTVETFEPLRKPKPGTIDVISGVDQSLTWQDPGPYVAIPRRYAAPKTSGLTWKIVPGEQTFDILLSDK